MFHFYNTFLNLYNIVSLFYNGIVISSTFFGFLFDLVTAVLFPKNSPALWTTFLEVVFTTFNPVASNYFQYFLTNDKNPCPVIYFLFLVL